MCLGLRQGAVVERTQEHGVNKEQQAITISHLTGSLPLVRTGQPDRYIQDQTCVVSQICPVKSVMISQA